MPLFAETFNKEVSKVLCEKPIIFVQLLFELRNVVIQDSDDGKRTISLGDLRKLRLGIPSPTGKASDVGSHRGVC